MKTFGLVFTLGALGLVVACSGTDHRIGGSSAPIGQGGSSGSGSGGTTGDTGGTASATGGGPAEGGSAGTVSHTGGVGGSAGTGVAGTTGHTGGVGGSAGSGTGGGPASQCHEDSDCQLVSFMCTGCDCLALGPDDNDPVCPGQGVQCFADPCMNKEAICESGQCQVNDNNCPAGQTQRNICIACGPAGGCSEIRDVCTKTCASNQDCAGFTYGFCSHGLCQAGGCI